MNTPVTNKLPTSVTTKYVRLYGLEWLGHPSLRMELLGCTKNGDELPTRTPDQSIMSKITSVVNN